MMVSIGKYVFLIFAFQFIWVQGKSQVFDKDSAMLYVGGEFDTLFFEDFTPEMNIVFLKKVSLYKKYVKLEKRTKSKSLNWLKQKYSRVLGAYISFENELEIDTIITTSNEKESGVYLIDELKSKYLRIIWLKSIFATTDLEVTLNNKSYKPGSTLKFNEGGLVYPYGNSKHDYEVAMYIRSNKKLRKLTVWMCLLHQRTYDNFSVD